MNNIQHIDLAILGGGCAGLSLARELAKQGVKKSVLVLEPRQEYQDDKSWCFWADEQKRYAKWASYKWTGWKFGLFGKSQQIKQSPDHFYHYIRSLDFYQSSLATLQQSSSVQIKLGCTVKEVIEHTDGVLINTDHRTYFAKQVVDTRPPAADWIQKATLIQSFLGIEIQLTEPSGLNANALELMTEMRLINGAFAFNYILPFTDRHLLVEVTFFSNPPPSRELLLAEVNAVLQNRGWSHATVLRTEFGMLPMGLPDSGTPQSRRIVRAGLVAGALRPSSGYGFVRIQRWAKRCANEYCSKNTVLPQVVSSFLIRQMDKLFLNVLKRQPDLTPELFDRMLSHASAEGFIRFMNDRASFADILGIVFSLPKTPFLKALLRLCTGR